MSIHNILTIIQANIDYAQALSVCFNEYSFNDSKKQLAFIIQFAIKSDNFYFKEERFDIDKLQNTFNCIDSNKAMKLVSRYSNDLIRTYLKKYGTKQEQERFLYRERGMTRLKEKENYAKYKDILAIDFIRHPNLVCNRFTDCRVALEFWQLNDCDNKINNIEELTRTVQGNTDKIESVVSLMSKIKKGA